MKRLITFGKWIFAPILSPDTTNTMEYTQDIKHNVPCEGFKRRRELPTGEQRFEIIRARGLVYVDKTMYVADLQRQGGFYFLSRPRRFGKSLFLSTLKAYFEGKKECFEGLFLGQWEEEQAAQEGRDAWQQYPVLHMDFNSGKYTTLADLESALHVQLTKWETLYGKNENERTFSSRFEGIIQRAYEKTHKQVIVLVDEYDKPLP